MEVGRTPMNLRFYAGEATPHHRQSPIPPRDDGPRVSPCASRSASSGRSRRGTSRSTSRRASSDRRSPPAMSWCSSRRELTPLIGQRLVEALLAGGLAAERDRPGPGCTAWPEPRSRRTSASMPSRSPVPPQVGEAIHAQVGPSAPRSSSRWAARTPSWSLDDADLDRAAALIVKGAFGLVRPGVHGHQPGDRASTRSTTRLLDRVVGAAAEALARRARARPGRGHGCAGQRAQLEKFLDYVRIGLDEGAELRLWRSRPWLDGTGRLSSPPDGLHRRAARTCGWSPRRSSARCSPSCGRFASTRRSRWPTTREFGLSAGIVTNDVTRRHAFARPVRTAVW